MSDFIRSYIWTALKMFMKIGPSEQFVVRMKFESRNLDNHNYNNI